MEHASSKKDAIVPPRSPPPSATSQHEPLPNKHQPAKPQHTSKFYLSDDDDQDEDDEEETIQDANGADDDGFWSTVRSNDTSFILNNTCQPAISAIPPAKEKSWTETNTTDPSTLHKDPFQKQIPPKVADRPPQQSLLTSMLISKPITPMVRPRRIIPSQRINKHQSCTTNDIDLSQSLRYCVDWEQRQNNTCTGGASNGGGLDPRVANDHPSILASSYWDSFQGW